MRADLLDSPCSINYIVRFTMMKVVTELRCGVVGCIVLVVGDPSVARCEGEADDDPTGCYLGVDCPHCGCSPTYSCCYNHPRLVESGPYSEVTWCPKSELVDGSECRVRSNRFVV